MVEHALTNDCLVSNHFFQSVKSLLDSIDSSIWSNTNNRTDRKGGTSARASPVPGSHRIKNRQSASPSSGHGTTSSTSPASPGDRPRFRFLDTDVDGVLLHPVSLAGAEEPEQRQAAVGYDAFVGDSIAAKATGRQLGFDLDQLELLKRLREQVRDGGGSDNFSFYKGNRQGYYRYRFYLTLPGTVVMIAVYLHCLLVIAKQKTEYTIELYGSNTNNKYVLRSGRILTAARSWS